MSIFTDEFIGRLRDKVTNSDLAIIHKELIEFCANYDIAPKETAITLYEDVVPKWYDTYIAYKIISGRAKGTLVVYNLRLMDFFYNIDKPIGEIDTNDIYRYLYDVKRRRNIANITLDQVRVILNNFYEWSVNEGYVRKNPCNNVLPIKYTEKIRVPLTYEQLELVRDACTTYRDKAMIEFFYSTGCRCGEVSEITWDCIDFGDMSAIVHGKGDKFRKVFFTPKAKIALLKYKMTRCDNDPHVFVSLKYPYSSLKSTGYKYVFRDIGKRAGLTTNFSPHILRHTFATHMLDKGAKLEDIQVLMGHANISTTLIYAKVDLSSLKTEHLRCLA